MISNGQEDELFEELLSEFKRIKARDTYRDSILAKLFIMKWRGIARLNPDKTANPNRMAEALKDYLNSD